MKILLAKPGLDGHDVGVKVLAYGLKEAGFEVEYTGLRKSIQEIVDKAVETKADVIGLSILSGTHLVLSARMKEEIETRNLSIPWFVGGNIPVEDIDAIKTAGATGAFATGTRIDEVVSCFRELEVLV